MNLNDELNMHEDVKKLEDLVDSGEVSPEELATAPIVVVEPSCKCNAGLEPIGTKLLCPKCFKEGIEGAVPNP